MPTNVKPCKPDAEPCKREISIKINRVTLFTNGCYLPKFFRMHLSTQTILQHCHTEKIILSNGYHIFRINLPVSMLWTAAILANESTTLSKDALLVECYVGNCLLFKAFQRWNATS